MSSRPSRSWWPPRNPLEGGSSSPASERSPRWGSTPQAMSPASRRGAAPLPRPTMRDAEKLGTKAVAEVRDFDPGAFYPAKQMAMLDRVAQFAVVASREAVLQSGLDFHGELGERTAAIIGTGAGGMNTTEDNYHRVFRRRRHARPPAGDSQGHGQRRRQPGVHVLRPYAAPPSSWPAPAPRPPTPSASPSTWFAPAPSSAPSPAAPTPA